MKRVFIYAKHVATFTELFGGTFPRQQMEIFGEKGNCFRGLNYAPTVFNVLDHPRPIPGAVMEVIEANSLGWVWLTHDDSAAKAAHERKNR